MQVFHPNIDLEGNVCLNILREDWKPVLSINSVLFGLSFLFMVSFPKAALCVIFSILYSFLSTVMEAFLMSTSVTNTAAVLPKRESE